MKKVFVVLLVLMAVCSAVCAAAADTQRTKYESEHITMELPEGVWYKKEGKPGFTNYYEDPKMTTAAGIIMITDKDITIRSELTDEYYQEFYDHSIENFKTAAVEGIVEYEDRKVNGNYSRIVHYKQIISGTEFDLYGFFLLKDNAYIIVHIVDKTKSPEEMINYVKGMVDSVVRK